MVARRDRISPRRKHSTPACFYGIPFRPSVLRDDFSFSGHYRRSKAFTSARALRRLYVKLFRSHVRVGRVPGGLTRAQLTQLANSLGDIESDLDNLRIQRVRAELERLGQQQEAFDTLVMELMKQPDVKLRIDQLVEHETARQLDQKTNLQADIARLQKDRGEWEDRIRREKAEHKKLRDETSKVVKAAFDKARAEGVSTLAEVAIFQALSVAGNEVKPINEPVARQSVLLAPLVIRDLAPGDKDVISMFRSLGISANVPLRLLPLAKSHTRPVSLSASKELQRGSPSRAGQEQSRTQVFWSIRRLV